MKGRSQETPNRMKINMDPGSKHNRFIYFFIFALAILAHLAGLLNDVFISDSALYASIAKEMASNNDFLNLTFDGVDWLDKPHFQFWITAISYKIFGINAFAYKLPAILFTLLALVYTYKLARELYDRETALLAVLVLATAEHLVISNNDVRAEPYLTGLIIASIYYYHRLIRDFRIGSLVLASLFAAMAIMTKGLFTLIPIIGAAGSELILKRNWKVLLSWRWIFSLGLIFLFILPELYSLYYQFDSHPEKIVFGRTGVSGIRFFVWDSQFGRFLNTGPIRGSGDPFFFLHTLLWAFLPWSILMYYAIFRRIRNSIPRIERSEEFYTLGGTLLTLLVFSVSSFQLPHYTNILFPLLAILTADFIRQASTRAELRFFAWAQYSVIFLILTGLFFLQLFFKPESKSILAGITFLLSGAGLVLIMVYRTDGKFRVLVYTCLASLLLNFYLNLVFYPRLLEYQSGTKAALYANDHYPGQAIKTLGVMSYTIHFHADEEVRIRTLKELEKEAEEEKLIVFTSEPYLDSLSLMGIDYHVLADFDHYRITMVRGSFLNHKTRAGTLRKHYLLQTAKQSAGPEKIPRIN